MGKWDYDRMWTPQDNEISTGRYQKDFDRMLKTIDTSSHINMICESVYTIIGVQRVSASLLNEDKIKIEVEGGDEHEIRRCLNKCMIGIRYELIHITEENRCEHCVHQYCMKGGSLGPNEPGHWCDDLEIGPE